MKPDIRWQVLLALVGLSLVLMLLSFQVQSAGLCTVTIPASGGTFVEGLVGRPNTLNPLLSDPYPVDRELVNLIYDGLVRIDESGEVRPALAESWAYSDDGLTLTFNLRRDASWHDGQPFTAEDVAFTYGLMKDEAFPGQRNLADLWGPVSIEVIDDYTIAFTLPQAYAPFVQATARGILPAHLWADTHVADLATSSLNTAPVGTGPFMVEAGQDWTRTNRLRLLPNPLYWRGGTQIGALEFRFFQSTSDLLAAYAAGELHAANDPAVSEVPDALNLEGTRIFTSREPRYAALMFNFGEYGATALKTREVRQAMAYGLNRDQIIDSALNGQGIVFDGPFVPSSWAYRPDLVTRYGYSPETAAELLNAAGWEIGGDGIRRQDDNSLAIRLLTLADEPVLSVANGVAQQWRALGADVTLAVAEDAGTFRELLDNGDFDVALVDVNAPGDPDLYDFFSQEAILRGQNYGEWNNRRASEALETARQVSAQSERAAYYEAFLRQYDADLPALTLFQYARTFLLHDSVQQAEIGRIWEPRDRYTTFPRWFLNFREVAVTCPEGSS